VQGKKDRNHIGDIVIIPVRCFTCGKVISQVYEDYKRQYEEYKRIIESGGNPKKTPREILNDLELDRYCCRRMIISHVDLVEDSAPYE
jgi:DNA-directed RNA polymerase subunit N (RpoN/RPB10)